MATTNPYAGDDRTMVKPLEPLPQSPTGGMNTDPAAPPVAQAQPQKGLITGAVAPITAQDTTRNVANATTQNATTQTATATGYDAAGWGATNWNVDPNQTVAKQADNVLSKDSPLLQKAQSDALQTANGRGILNSTMAAGAGTGALIDRALQIATPDAQTYASAAQFNANASNQAAASNAQMANDAAAFTANAKNNVSQFNANAKNTTSQFNAQAANNASLANAQAANAATDRTASLDLAAKTANQQNALDAAKSEYNGQLSAAMAGADAANKQALARMDANVKTSLANIEAQFKTTMQASSSAAQMYSDTMKSIAQIMTDKDMDAGNKQSMIDQQMSALKNALVLQSKITNIPGLSDLIGNLNQGVGGTATTPINNGSSNIPPPNYNFPDPANGSGYVNTGDRGGGG